MPTSTQSFTLDDAERRRIVYGSQSLQALKDSQAICASNDHGPVEAVGKSQHSSSRSPHALPIFDFTYSQNFSQTQEDTSSFKQQLDSAPPVDRPITEVGNIYDVDEEIAEDDLRPLQTSTALQLQTGQNDLLSTPSVVRDAKDEVQFTIPSRPAPTHAVARTLHTDTPVGLTQMFQSSQDTPVVQHRKSTYVSMKASRNRQLPNPGDEDSGEDDIDFPKIRRGSSDIVRSSAAHSIMDRLRERTGMNNRPAKDIADQTLNSNDEQLSSRDRSPENFVIPASAPLNTQVPSGRSKFEEISDSVITESQTHAGVSHVRQVSSQTVVPFSQVNDTIQFDLPSSFPDDTTGEISLSKDDEPSITADINVDSAQTTKSPVTKDCDREGNDPVETSPALRSSEIACAELVNLPEQDSFQTGQKGKPIMLKDTPLEYQRPGEFARVDGKLQRSTSHDLPSASTAVCTSIGTSHRSRSMYTPQQLPDLVMPDYSSPVLQARDRRRSGRIPVIDESPVDIRILRTPRKRQLVYSSLGNEADVFQTSRRPLFQDRPRKRLRTSTIHDSQSIREEARAVQTPAQPVFHVLDHRTSVRGTEPIGSDISRTVSQMSTTSTANSSPLTSLASEDFVQETSPHHFARPGTTRWSRRVLALHRETGSYYPGELVGSAVTAHNFAEDALVSIKFDDTDETDIELLHVRPLDLRVGDVVKVNVFGMILKQLTITSLERDAQNGTLFTDINGNTSFEARRRNDKTVARYTIDQLYIPSNLMKSFLKRQFSTIQKSVAVEQPTTPSRRQPPRDLSPTLSFKSTPPVGSVRLFSGISFSVTIFNPKTILRDKVERKVICNGGHLLSQGLDELFEYSPFNDSKDIAPLRLTSAARMLKAAVVIADQPSRRAKYLQALSLGLPCLHFSYIDDCLTARKLLDIYPYLLAAGDGVLGGHTISMSMNCTLTSLSSSTTLAHAIEKRRRIYDKKSVIIVIGPPEQVDSRKIHYFLAWAMCAREITDVPTLSDAYRLFQKPEDGKRWDLISVPHFTEEVEEMDGLKGKVVTSDDVVQSLITGRVCVSY